MKRSGLRVSNSIVFSSGEPGKLLTLQYNNSLSEYFTTLSLNLKSWYKAVPNSLHEVDSQGGGGGGGGTNVDYQQGYTSGRVVARCIVCTSGKVVDT